jgi:(E)-4-hydroxy-3-methylbut-2-enyl-diphosphate synthase
VKSAKVILKSLGLKSGGIEIVSCPTCGRTNIDLIDLESRVEKMLEKYKDLSLKVAVMGCAVNGPGESREADYGIAGGKGEGLVFSHGEIIEKVSEDRLVDRLIEIVEQDAE